MVAELGVEGITHRRGQFVDSIDTVTLFRRANKTPPQLREAFEICGQGLVLGLAMELAPCSKTTSFMAAREFTVLGRPATMIPAWL